MSTTVGFLGARVNQRLKEAYRPKTWSAYKAMLITYMAYCEFVHVDFQSPDVVIWLTFIEFLVYNGLKASSINNYISAVKSMFKWFNLKTPVFHHPKVNSMLRAVELSVHRTPLQKGIFHIDLFKKLIQACHSFPLSSVFKTIYLFAFFGFFRISNLAPASKLMFDIKMHLCRGDVIVHDEFLIILVKWSKTLQVASKGTYVIIPQLKGSQICPMKAFKTMLLEFPATGNAPLFLGPAGPITQSQIRSHLQKVLSLLNLNPKHFSFHTFRRSGATLAFNNNVELQHIKKHGTWTSDAVNAYIVTDPLTSTSVATSFQRLLT